ncbi:MAG: DUF1801 domain-containing protein [Rhizobiaceae bacterium]
MPRRAFENPDVEAAYQAFREPVRGKLLDLRELAFEVEEQTEGAGPIVEELKWGQPSFVISGKHGSTFRLGEIPEGQATHALYFLCQTTLVGTFREHYGDVLDFKDNRAMVFLKGRDYPRDAIAHCMALAMTYRLKVPKKSRH